MYNYELARLLENGVVEELYFVSGFVLLKDVNSVKANLEKWSRKVERLLGTHLPVATKIEAIHKDITLCPTIEKQIRILRFSLLNP